MIGRLTNSDILVLRSALRDSIEMLSAGMNVLSGVDPKRCEQLAKQIQRNRAVLEAIGGKRHWQDRLELAPYLSEGATA